MNLTERGVTLIELLVAMAISALIGILLIPALSTFQARGLAEISRSDLQDRAGRLIRFIARDLGETAFLVGPTPRTVNNESLRLVQTSQPGDPLQTFSSALIPENRVNAFYDGLTLVKAVSFYPPIRLVQTAQAGTDTLQLNRRPNRPPGSSREIYPAPDALNHIALEGGQACYGVASADHSLQLSQALDQTVAKGAEVLGVRAIRYLLKQHGPTHQLRRDNYTSLEILDDAVDGLQFEYLLADGSISQSPADSSEIRAIRVHLLVRDLRADRGYTDTRVYQLADQQYGPFHDSYRRLIVTRLVEVKNHGFS